MRDPYRFSKNGWIFLVFNWEFWYLSKPANAGIAISSFYKDLSSFINSTYNKETITFLNSLVF